jgi:uncharacterized protein
VSRAIELLRLIAVCEQVEGRKKLQKIVHILREAGYPFPFRYGYHFHGPFSAELKGEIDSLVTDGLIDEIPGETLYDNRMYSYRLSKEAEEFCLGDDRHPEPQWASLARILNEKPAQELEAISTLIYLVRSGFREEALADRFAQLKPHLRDYYSTAQASAKLVISNHALHAN